MIFSESLKKNKDFQYVYRNGKSYANKILVMYIKKNDLGKNRLGISVSKKVGNSVVRHHLTRLIRESYRLNKNNLKKGNDIVFLWNKNANFHKINFNIINTEIISLLNKAKMV